MYYIFHILFLHDVLFHHNVKTSLIKQLCHLDNWSSHFILWNNFFEGLFLRSWWRWEWGTKVSSHYLIFQFSSVNVSKVEHNFMKCKKSLIISSSVVQNPWNCVVGFLIELILNVIFNRYVYKHADLRPWDPRNDVLQ